MIIAHFAHLALKALKSIFNSDLKTTDVCKDIPLNFDMELWIASRINGSCRSTFWPLNFFIFIHVFLWISLYFYIEFQLYDSSSSKKYKYSSTFWRSSYIKIPPDFSSYKGFGIISQSFYLFVVAREPWAIKDFRFIYSIISDPCLLSNPVWNLDVKSLGRM